MGMKDKYFTDKMPLNFMWIGFIKILFPHAKIIHCKRDSRDNCVSLYKNVFEGGINFCYTQKEIAEYYNLYFDLMNFSMTLKTGDKVSIIESKPFSKNKKFQVMESIKS